MGNTIKWFQINCTSSTNKIVLNWDEELNFNDQDVKVLTLKPKSQNLTSHNITRREIIDEEDVTTESSDEEEVLVTTELPEPTEVISQKVECIFLDCKKVL